MRKLEDLLLLSKYQIDHLNCGRKIKNLIWMTKNGFINNIPVFFILESEECDQIAQSNEIPEEIYKKLQKYSSMINSEFYFIRSSASYEDEFGYPTAGLFSTIGRVTPDNLVNAIYKTIMSSKTERVKKILGFLPKISIIIQKMIFPDYSGILFTNHPVYNDDSLIIVEASYGLGETVVSGKYQTDYYEIKKKNLAICTYEIRQKNQYISPYSNSVQDVLENLRKSPVLTNDFIGTLSKYALILEEKYHKPIDLEWAIDGKKHIWFLQLRDAQ